MDVILKKGGQIVIKKVNEKKEVVIFFKNEIIRFKNEIIIF